MMKKVDKVLEQKVPRLIPVRMLNEFAYCPRLCFIEWVQSEFRDSADTVEGRYHHRRVDAMKGSVSEEALWKTELLFSGKSQSRGKGAR